MLFDYVTFMIQYYLIIYKIIQKPKIMNNNHYIYHNICQLYNIQYNIYKNYECYNVIGGQIFVHVNYTHNKNII